MPYVYWRCGPFAISVSNLGLIVCWNDHVLGCRLSILGWLSTLTGTARSSRDSPDDSRIGADVRGFPAFRQDRSEFRTATVTSDGPNGGRGADLAIFAGIWTHSSHRQLLNA